MADMAVVQVKGQGSRLHIGLLVSETLFSFIDHRREGESKKPICLLTVECVDKQPNMKEWTRRDRTERDKKVPLEENRTLTDWPSLSLRVTAPPLHSRPTLSVEVPGEGNVGQYVRTFVRTFCYPHALWVTSREIEAICLI